MFRKYLGLSLLVALTLSACGGGEPAPESAASTATPAAALTAAPTATQPAAPAAAVEETGSIPDIEAGLESLASYRARYIFSFEGKDADGKEASGSLEFLQEVIAASKDQHVRVSSTGMGNNASDSETFEFFTVGGVSYIYGMDDGVAKCASFSSGESASDPTAMFKPGDVLGGLNKARRVEQGVTVNGVKTDRYTFDETGISSGVFSKASGDVWLAQEGNFVVKYVGTATGKMLMFGGDTDGTATWDYQLEAINTLAAIELPEECLAQKPADDIPVPAGATDKAQFGGMITFKTTNTVDQVIEFYQTQMPAQGWTEGEASEFGGMRTLTFTKDDRSLNIMISSGDDGVSVIITEKKGE